MTRPDGGAELTILVVDDHAIVREGLKRILESTSGRWTVVEAGSGFQALEQLRQQSFDLGIFDLSMPGMTGLELLRRTRAAYPRMPVLMLSMNAEEQYAMRAFKAGAGGYVTKDSASAELANAVRKVAAGGTYVGSAMAERMVQYMSGALSKPQHIRLSDRELEVLRRLVAGERPTEIAAALHLSVKTISSHKTRMQEKLGVTSTAALIRYGLEHGLASGGMLPDQDA